MDILSILGLILAWTLTIVFTALYAVGTLLDGMCAFLFIYHAFIKKTKYFTTAFFYILSVGYILDIATFFVIILSAIATYYTEDDLYIGISEMMFYYTILLLGPWNTLMALNRFTAIWFWKNHEWYWRNSVFIPALIVMLGYPFLVGIPVILTSDSDCRFHPIQESCVVELLKTDFISSISNGIHVLLCAALGIITSLASKFNIIVTTPETKKIQQFLLIQSILSLIFFGFNLFYTLHGEIPDNEILETIIKTFSDSYSIFFRLSSTFLLFALSKVVRQSFASFYQWCCCCCCCCCKKRPKERRKISIQTKTIVKIM